MLKSLVISLLLTLLFEELFALAWGLRGKRELTIVALVNCLTNPAVVLLYHLSVGTWGLNGTFVTVLLECTAIVVEWRYYRSCSTQLKRPFLFSLLVNVISYSMGCTIPLL